MKGGYWMDGYFIILRSSKIDSIVSVSSTLR